MRHELGAERMIERLNIDVDHLDLLLDEPLCRLFVEALRIGDGTRQCRRVLDALPVLIMA